VKGDFALASVTIRCKEVRDTPLTGTSFLLNGSLSTILVLGMGPALAFFEAGMLRSKHTLSIISQVSEDPPMNSKSKPLGPRETTFPSRCTLPSPVLVENLTCRIVCQIFAGNVILSVMWLFFGYTFSFGSSFLGVIGGFDHVIWINTPYDK
jgi:hypothetical protein